MTVRHLPDKLHPRSTALHHGPPAVRGAACPDPSAQRHHRAGLSPACSVESSAASPRSLPRSWPIDGRRRIRHTFCEPQSPAYKMHHRQPSGARRNPPTWFPTPPGCVPIVSPARLVSAGPRRGNPVRLDVSSTSGVALLI
jgi:hypothetical protein